jgi:hypothetical protein
VGGLSQMKLASFEKNCHILRRSLKLIDQNQIDFLVNTPFSGAVLLCTEDTFENEKNTTPREQFYITI